MAKKSNSEAFRKVRKQKIQDSEDFGRTPNVSEKTPDHILTVQDVAKTLEKAGVPRTERSIINWCKKDVQGASRLDSFFDENEKRHFITPKSVQYVIAEEKNKLKMLGRNVFSESFRNSSENPGNDSEAFGTQANDFGNVPNASETDERDQSSGGQNSLATQNRLLLIEIKAKDMYIEHLEKNNSKLIEDVKQTSNLLGKMEEKVRQLEAPKQATTTKPESKTETGKRVSSDVTDYEVVGRPAANPEQAKAEQPHREQSDSSQITENSEHQGGPSTSGSAGFEGSLRQNPNRELVQEDNQ